MTEPAEAAVRVPDLGVFRLGEWSVRQSEGVVSSEDRSVRLEPRVMDVLACLAAGSGRVLAKEELLARVWGGAFVEEGALSQAVHSLRKALGDDARQPRYVQTIPKRGYRLLVPAELERSPVEGVGEVSPDPIPPGSTNPGLPPEIRGSRRARILSAIASLVLALAVWIAWDLREEQRHPLGELAEAQDGARIVVLPFEDLDKPQDPYFAAGLTEEITTNLTLLSGLRVIPGRNALNDKGLAKPLAEIAEELKADYVLLGQVSWLPGGKQVRVLPKLIRTADETIVFATPFQGDAHSPFKTQQEISRAVLSTLDIALTPEQDRTLGERSTESPEAYRAYVQGLVLKDQPFYSPPHLEKAARMFEQAVEADPNFAEAWAELSQVHSYLAFNTDRSSKRREQARRTMEKAVALAPDLVTTRLAQAYFSYWCLEDYTASLKHLSAAAAKAPNLSKIFEMRGLLLRRLGRLKEAITDFKRALELNRQAAELVWTIAETYGALRDYEKADAYFEQAISLAPDEPFNYEQRAHVRLAWTGDLNEARAIIDDSPVRESPQLQLAAVCFDLYERKFRQVLTRVSAENRKKLSFADQSRLDIFRAVALERLGAHQEALALAKDNLSALELRMAQFSRHSHFYALSAVTFAQLGRLEEALARADQAVEQSRQDAFSGPRIIEYQAMANAILGRRREAMALLERLLSIPYRDPISRAELRLDPIWDPLRGDAEFEAISK